MLMSRTPTVNIGMGDIGMDVSHGSPGQTDVPSIAAVQTDVPSTAAVVSSREWPLISKYRASVKTQSSKVEMEISNPFDVIEEDPPMMRASTNDRVDSMFDQIRQRLPVSPEFLLCLLPEKKNSDIYGPWKRNCVSEFGIVYTVYGPYKGE